MLMIQGYISDVLHFHSYEFVLKIMISSLFTNFNNNSNFDMHLLYVPLNP